MKSSHETIYSSSSSSADSSLYFQIASFLSTRFFGDSATPAELLTFPWEIVTFSSKSFTVNLRSASCLSALSYSVSHSLLVWRTVLPSPDPAAANHFLSVYTIRASLSSVVNVSSLRYLTFSVIVIAEAFCNSRGMSVLYN